MCLSLNKAGTQDPDPDHSEGSEELEPEEPRPGNFEVRKVATLLYIPPKYTFV